MAWLPAEPSPPSPHQGQVQGGLRSGIRIAQGSYFRVTLLKPTPVQVDGEPWVQAPGHMIISAASPKVSREESQVGPAAAGSSPTLMAHGAQVRLSGIEQLPLDGDKPPWASEGECRAVAGLSTCPTSCNHMAPVPSPSVKWAEMALGTLAYGDQAL